ncbi:MAG: thioredoxin [Gemmatimonadota bacterium]
MPEPGFHVVLKDDCPTCRHVVPVLRELEAAGRTVHAYYQDQGDFLAGLDHIVDDRELAWSFHFGAATVPTVIEVGADGEVQRAEGWVQEEWRALTGIVDLGSDRDAWKPGCGSLSVLPGVAETLEARYGSPGIAARPVDVDRFQDPIEVCYDRGWSDGLPVVPPTPERILRMLAGTDRAADDVVGIMPPDLVECTVEKVAINAVMAGCLPEYMPLLLGIIDAALEPMFTLHGIVCTTCFSSPVIIVNGPVAKKLGMNSGIGALGPGNRANATIGRALNLIVRNVGGGRPGEIDRSTLGAPSKYTFCFAEDESDPEWEPLSVSRGVALGRSAVTLFQGEGLQGVVDQRSRTAEELTLSIAASLLAVTHPKLCRWGNVVLVLSPEHYGIFREAGWDRTRITSELHAACERPGRDVIRGAHGIGEGVPEEMIDDVVPKFHPDGLLIVRAGGQAGLYSAILSGWIGGRAHDDSRPVTKEIDA